MSRWRLVEEATRETAHLATTHTDGDGKGLLVIPGYTGSGPQTYVNTALVIESLIFRLMPRV